MSVLIFALLGSIPPEDGRTRADEVRQGLFSMIAFILGALTSCLSGYLGMKIATYANGRTAVEARRGIAPAFMCGESRAARRQALPSAFSSVILAVSLQASALAAITGP